MSGSSSTFDEKIEFTTAMKLLAVDDSAVSRDVALAGASPSSTR